MRVWENYFAMVLMGLALGVLTGGVPAYASEVSTVALVLAMTFSLTEVRFRGLSPRTEARALSRAVLLNYGALTGLILLLSLLFDDPTIRLGFVVMAAVPSAVAVIPITSVFQGNVRSALVSSAFLYVSALGLFPILTLLFAGEAADPRNLAFQIFLLIGLPLAVSRALVGRPVVERHRKVLVNVSFFVLVLTITGANRRVFLEDPSLIAALAGAALVRTWGIGFAVLTASRALGGAREVHIADALFGSLKNLGLAALLAFALFGPFAALPAIVCLFFEVAWILGLAHRFR